MNTHYYIKRLRVWHQILPDTHITHAHSPLGVMRTMQCKSLMVENFNEFDRWLAIRQSFSLFLLIFLL